MSMEWGSQQAPRLHGEPAATRASRSACCSRPSPSGSSRVPRAPDAVRDLGMAHPVPDQHRAGRHRLLRPAAPSWRPRSFARLRKEQAVVKQPVLEVFRTQPRAVFTSAFVRMAEQAPFYLFITFVLAYGEKHLELDRNDLLNDTLVAAAIGFVSVPLFGFLSDILGRRLVYGTGIVLVGLFAFPYYGLLNSKESGLVLLGIVVSLILHDIMYGPQAALISETFGTGVRYSGAGLGYQLASIIAGGPAPLIATAILAQHRLVDVDLALHHRLRGRVDDRAAAHAAAARQRPRGRRGAGARAGAVRAGQRPARPGRSGSGGRSSSGSRRSRGTPRRRAPTTRRAPRRRARARRRPRARGRPAPSPGRAPSRRLATQAGSVGAPPCEPTIR